MAFLMHTVALSEQRLRYDLFLPSSSPHGTLIVVLSPVTMILNPKITLISRASATAETRVNTDENINKEKTQFMLQIQFLK